MQTKSLFVPEFYCESFDYYIVENLLPSNVWNQNGNILSDWKINTWMVLDESAKTLLVKSKVFRWFFNGSQLFDQLKIFFWKFKWKLKKTGITCLAHLNKTLNSLKTYKSKIKHLYR